MQTTGEPSKGLRVFIIVWLGQLVSLLGTSITRFAVTLWAWEVTGQATALSLAAFFGVIPIMLMSPIAGALVDRWNRKLVIMLSDLGAVGATVLLFILSATGNLEIWHIYLTSFIAGTFESFQYPAFSASITTMVDKEQYARAGAMMGMAEMVSGIFAPILATAFYATIHLEGVLLLDIATCLIAILTIAIVHIPQPAVSPDSQDEGKGSLFKEAIYGFQYIWKRPSLFGLQMFFFVGNFLYGVMSVLISALILSRTDNNQLILRDFASIMALGGLVSSFIISVWGGPKRRINGVLWGWGLAGIFPIIGLAVGQTPIVWLASGFIGALAIAVVNPSNQAIWQSKIPPHIQGRVFSARRLIAQFSGPFALLIAGPLADYVFEPAMQSEGWMLDLFGGIVGTGTGSGIAVMFLIIGCLIVVMSITAYLIPVIRNVEDIIPDHQDSVTTKPSIP